VNERGEGDCEWEREREGMIDDDGEA